MKQSKRITALICVVCFLCSMIAFAEISEQKATILSEYGIVFDKATENSVVTRAQMIKIACGLLQLSKTAEDTVLTENVFSDVSTEHPFAGYVSIAKSMGIICGYPDGSFLPERGITVCETLKILLAVLGYLPKAQEEGEYPHSIMMLSNQIGLTKGIAVEAQAVVSFDVVSSLLENALDIPFMVQTGWGAFEEYQVNPALSLRKNFEKSEE